MAKLLLGKKKVLEEMDMLCIAETATTTVVELGNCVNPSEKRCTPDNMKNYRTCSL
jgi:hypothetical protein